jgi:hypothetical protein
LTSTEYQPTRPSRSDTGKSGKASSFEFQGFNAKLPSAKPLSLRKSRRFIGFLIIASSDVYAAVDLTKNILSISYKQIFKSLGYSEMINQS